MPAIRHVQYRISELACSRCHGVPLLATHDVWFPRSAPAHSCSLRGGPRHRIRRSPVEAGRDPGRVSCHRHPDTAHMSRRDTSVDALCSDGILGDIRQRGVWRHRLQCVQCGTCDASVPILCLSGTDERRQGVCQLRFDTRTGLRPARRIHRCYSARTDSLIRRRQARTAQSPRRCDLDMGRIHRAYPGLVRRDLDPVHPHRRGDTSRHRHSIMANHAECGCRRTAHGMDSQCVRDLDISGVVPVTT